MYTCSIDAATALNLVQSVTPGWRRHEQREPKLRHGHHIFLESEQARIDAAVAISTEKEPVASAMATLASPSSQPLPNISGPPVSTPARVGASSANPASDDAHFAPHPSPANLQFAPAVGTLTATQQLTPQVVSALMALPDKDANDANVVTALAAVAGQHVNTAAAAAARNGIINEAAAYQIVHPSGSSNNIHALRFALASDVAPTAVQQAASTIDSRPPIVAANAGAPVSTPVILGQHPQMDRTMYPQQPGISIHRRRQPSPATAAAGGGTAVNAAARAARAAVKRQRRAYAAAAKCERENEILKAGGCLERRGCPCTKCREKHAAARAANSAAATERMQTIRQDRC